MDQAEIMKMFTQKRFSLSQYNNHIQGDIE
jgi:hypothetical protein